MLYAHSSEAAATAAADEHAEYLAREAADKPAAEDGSSGRADPLDRLRAHPQFDELRRVLQTNPGALPQVLAQIGAQDAALLGAIHENEQAFHALMGTLVHEPQAAGQAAAAGAPHRLQ